MLIGHLHESNIYHVMCQGPWFQQLVALYLLTKKSTKCEYSSCDGTSQVVMIQGCLKLNISLRNNPLVGKFYVMSVEMMKG